MSILIWVGAILLFVIGFAIGISKIGRAIRHAWGTLHDDDYDDFHYEDD